MLSIIYRHWLGLSSVALLIISIASLRPLVELPALPGTDKTHHLMSYAALVLPIGLRQPRYWLWLLLGCIAWSGAIELIQPYVNRYGEWLDLVANAVGVVCGASLGHLLRRFVDVK